MTVITTTSFITINHNSITSPFPPPINHNSKINPLSSLNNHENKINPFTLLTTPIIT